MGKEGAQLSVLGRAVRKVAAELAAGLRAQLSQSAGDKLCICFSIGAFLREATIAENC